MSYYSTESVVGDAALDCPTLEELYGRKPTHMPPLVNGVASRIDDRVVEVLWWPVSLKEARLCGAHTPASSVLLRLCIDDTMLKALNDIIPDSIKPRQIDTAATLAKRLDSCKWLDELRVKKGGRGPSLVALNTTSYAQPRRVTWSVVVSNPAKDSDGDMVLTLFSYHQFGHCPTEVKSRAMPRPVYDFMFFLWEAAHDVLGPCSKRSPPTMCQLMVYHVLFHGSIGRHRDFFTSADNAHALLEGKNVFSEGSCRAAPPEGFSHVPNSDVMVWTTGTATMVLYLSFPPKLSDGVVRDRRSYVIHPRFSVPCMDGTLFVFTAMDDLHFCHEAKFESLDDTLGYRFAFVFRWIHTKDVFYAAPKHNFARKPSST